jgi:hypothetical protein
MPGSETWNATSDTGRNGNKKKRRNSNTHLIHIAIDHLKHRSFLLSHILKNYSTVIYSCQFFCSKISRQKSIFFVTVLYKKEAVSRFLSLVIKSSSAD